MIRAAAFDFDGVILESSDIKTRAFAELFSDHPEQVEEIVALHLDNEGVSRYEKFRRIGEEILGRPFGQAQMEELGQRFSAIVWEQMVGCPFVPGATELLQSRSAQLALFVASGTPEEELLRLAAERGIANYFTGIYGTPPTKAEILERILAERELDPGELLFVGDADTDIDGARAAGVPFVGRVREGAPNPFADAGVRLVSDLAELDRDWDDLVSSPPPVPAR